MHTELLVIDISSIIVKSTFRAELGDLTSLENSIRKLGLLCPIIVDNNNTLIAGARRLQACRNLGLTRIPVVKTNVGSKSMDALDIQADENLCRQNVSPQDLERHIQAKKNHMTARHTPSVNSLWSKLKKLFA